MKPIYKKTALFLFAALLLSCSRDSDPISGWDDNYTSPSHAYASVNRLYRTGAPSFWGNSTVYMGPWATYGGFMAALFDNEYKGQAVICHLSQQLTIDPVNIADQLDGVWNECYKAIGLANQAIREIPKMSGLEKSEKDDLLGQAHFFRAFNYFYLVKYFGDVPLMKEPFISLEKLYPQRAPIAQVYSFIVDDLKLAVSKLPNIAFTKNGHKVSQTTAETVLADVYLTMSGFPLLSDNYANAVAAAKSVIHSGQHKLTLHDVGLGQLSAYNKMRTSNNETEFIYSYQHDPAISSNELAQISLPKRAVSWGVFKYSITNNAYRPIRAYLNVYDSVPDLRMHERQFFHTSYTYTNQNGQKVKDVYAHAPWYWFDETALIETAVSRRDVAIYRYPEVLLIAAEAIAQSEGVTDEAVRYLADVRARAYIYTTRAMIEHSLKSLSKEKFIEEVWIERMRELPFEMRTWSDIQRTRRYPKTSTAQKGKATFVNVVGATNPWGQIFKEDHLLYPISDNEMKRNRSLVQNPGYYAD